MHPMTQNLHTKHGSYESQSTRILRAEKSYGARLEKIRSAHTDFGTENRTPEPLYRNEKGEEHKFTSLFFIAIRFGLISSVCADESTKYETVLSAD